MAVSVRRDVADPVVDDSDRERRAANVDRDLGGGGARVLGDVGERLADHGEEVVGERLGHRGVDRAVEADSGIEAERAGRFGRQSDQFLANRRAREPRRVQLEDRGANVADRGVEIVDRRHEPIDDRLVVHQPERGLQSQPHGEQSLDHRVVEIASDPFAILEGGEVRDAGMEASVLDGDSGGGGETDRQFLVDIGEHVTIRLVAEVQVAEHLATNGDRHAEEGRHLRMIRGKPEPVRMLAQIR